MPDVAILSVSMSENTPLMKRAAALIARRAHSRGELRRKLTAGRKAQNEQKAESADKIEAVLDRLEHLNLLNDAEFAYNFAFYHISKLGWGEEKVREALLYRDVTGADADRAIDRVREEIAEDGQSGQSALDGALIEYVESYCRKHGTPSSLKDAQKLARHLAGRGFDENGIIDALERVISPEIIRHFRIGD